MPLLGGSGGSFGLDAEELTLTSSAPFEEVWETTADANSAAVANSAPMPVLQFSCQVKQVRRCAPRPAPRAPRPPNRARNCSRSRSGKPAAPPPRPPLRARRAVSPRTDWEAALV